MDWLAVGWPERGKEAQGGTCQSDILKHCPCEQIYGKEGRQAWLQLPIIGPILAEYRFKTTEKHKKAM
jgi:hypothetical protein